MKTYLRILFILLGKVVSDFCTLSIEDCAKTYKLLIDHICKLDMLIKPPLESPENDVYLRIGVLFVGNVLSVAILIGFLLLK